MHDTSRTGEAPSTSSSIKLSHCRGPQGTAIARLSQSHGCMAPQAMSVRTPVAALAIGQSRRGRGGGHPNPSACPQRPQVPVRCLR
jgi:hypothetical protein